ncbi:MAG: FKBP-type peptidyl-prolyl cis-trans isomerase [Halothiobacillaceae bacterium]
MNEARIDRHSRVTLHYEVQIEDGTVVDSTFEAEPLSFAMGDGQLLPNLEDCLLGLTEGEQTRILIPASEGFGYRTTEAIHDVPRADFPEGLDPQPQQVIDFQTPTGESVPGMVVEAGEDTVRVDFNHPLSGHDIQFIVHVLSVEGPTAEAEEK